jgi:hypothetical protein
MGATMIVPPGRVGRWLAALAVAAGTALTTLFLQAPAAVAAAEATDAAPRQHVVVAFGLEVSAESAPRDLAVNSGDVVEFQNGSPLAYLTPVRVTVGPDTLVVGIDPVVWTATAAGPVRYEGTYTPVPGPWHTITVAPLSPAGPPAGLPPAGKPAPAPGAARPPARSGSTHQAPGLPGAAGTAGHPAVPGARPGDPGYVPSGAHPADAPPPVASHRSSSGESMTEVAPPALTHSGHQQMALSRSSSAPRPLRLALAVLAFLLLVGVGGSLMRVVFRAWLNAAPTPS